MLLSGTDAHLGGLGVLIEYKQNEKGAKRWAGKAGYEGYLNEHVATLPEILGDNGYFTAMAGKVHLLPSSILLFHVLNIEADKNSGISGFGPVKDLGNVAFKRHLPCFQVVVTITVGNQCRSVFRLAARQFTRRTGAKLRCGFLLQNAGAICANEGS